MTAEIRFSEKNEHSDCCLTPAQHFCQLYHGENKLICKEMMMRSPWY